MTKILDKYLPLPLPYLTYFILIPDLLTYFTLDELDSGKIREYK